MWSWEWQRSLTTTHCKRLTHATPRSWQKVHTKSARVALRITVHAHYCWCLPGSCCCCCRRHGRIRLTSRCMEAKHNSLCDSNHHGETQNIYIYMYMVPLCTIWFGSAFRLFRLFATVGETSKKSKNSKKSKKCKHLFTLFRLLKLFRLFTLWWKV